MDTTRIKEIQLETAYPDSHSVCEALLKVWNEVEQIKTKPPVYPNIFRIGSDGIAFEYYCVGQTNHKDYLIYATVSGHEPIRVYVKTMWEKFFESKNAANLFSIDNAKHLIELLSE